MPDDPLYWLGFVLGIGLVAALAWLSRKYVVARAMLRAVTGSIHAKKPGAKGETALALLSLTNTIAAEMLGKGLARPFNAHLGDNGHNEGDHLRDAVRGTPEEST